MRLQPELEATICRLAGIQAARVVTDGSGSPTEIHVLGTREKSPKQLVRDIQSIAMAQFDLDLDHRIVSIVQFDDDDQPGSGSRVMIATISARTSGLETTATVTLASGGLLHEGTSVSPATASSRPRMVARATLDAATKVVPLGACEVEAAEVVSVGGRRVAVSVIEILSPDGELIVTGSALVRGDEADAVARSVLSALNRRIRG
jgi:hypothetical protein